LQLEDRKPMQCRIRDLDTLAHEELPDLRQPQAVAEPAPDRRALLDALRPAVATWPTARGMQREQDLTDLLVAHRRRHAHASRLRRGEIPANRFRIEPELGGDPLLRQARAAEPKDFPDFNHGDLAIHPCLLVPGRSPEPETSIARSGERGERF
jgi:hypothetical protein